VGVTTSKHLARVTPALAAVLALTCSSPALAWGNDGHKVVVLIARHIIDKNPTLAAKMDAILAGPNDPSVGDEFAALGTWADAYRSSSDARYSATHNWHFIDLVIGDPNPVRDCFNAPTVPNGTLASAATPNDCVVGKINQFRKELGDTSVSPQERKLALLFLLHFVGDIHQPLHAAERDNDSGGNGVPIVYGTNKFGTALHGYWDTNAVKRLGSTPDKIAGVLNKDLDDHPPTGWVAPASDARTLSWAQDSYAVAHTYAYGKLKPFKRSCLISSKHGTETKSCTVIDAAYATAATGQARGQLEKAGVRLAAVITEALQ
jgi:hypothetical protein